MAWPTGNWACLVIGQSGRGGIYGKHWHGAQRCCWGGIPESGIFWCNPFLLGSLGAKKSTASLFLDVRCNPDVAPRLTSGGYEDKVEVISPTSILFIGGGELWSLMKIKLMSSLPQSTYCSEGKANFNAMIMMIMMWWWWWWWCWWWWWWWWWWCWWWWWWSGSGSGSWSWWWSWRL